MSKYLFVGAHCDDELCFGGMMLKLSEQGHEITYIPLSWCCKDDLIKECIESSKILKVSKIWIGDHDVRHFDDSRARIADYFSQLNGGYDFVFTHAVNDKHPDHRTVAEESLRCFTGNLFTYIGPWNGDENPNYFVELSESQLETKIKALECYKSQAHRAYMHPDFIRAQARYNGIRCGKLYSEGFKVVRLVQ